MINIIKQGTMKQKLILLIFANSYGLVAKGTHRKLGKAITNIVMFL